MVRTGLVAASISVLIPAVALGESLDLMNCRSGTVNMMHADKELTVFSVDLKGVSFTRNAKAEYVTMEGVFRRSDGTYDVRPMQGAANVLKIHIGINSGPRVNWNER